MNSNKKYILMNIVSILCIVLSYLVIDIGLRYITYNSYKFYGYYKLSPNLFSLAFISIFVGIYYLIDKKYKNIFYIISIVIFNIISYSQYVHFNILSRFYSINDMFLVKEGINYFRYAITKTNIKIIIPVILSIMFTVISIRLNKIYHEKYRDKLYYVFIICFTLLCFISLYTIGYLELGSKPLDENDSYDASTNILEVYKESNQKNKIMQLSGLYNYTYREIYLFFRNINRSNKDEIKEIENYLKDNNKTIESNKYTKVFKDKNVIVILMESIDSFLINDEAMPTLNKLRNEGINFTKRYSPAFGGGQTLNSEFALNTGLYTSTESTIYNLPNTYRNSLANKFKGEGYDVNSIHFNKGDYYNRQELHKNLGYNNHYSLLDMKNIDNNKYNYEYDSNLIKSKKVYDLIVRDNKYLTFITTYSAHLPYDIKNNKRCSKNKYKYFKSDTELSCLYNLARDTDEMIRLLIERLEKDKKLDDTVLVLVTDHYAYGYSYVNNIKNESNKYLIQNTPFIIWNNNIKHEEVDKLVDTADILPTILNMFDIDYDPNLYVGEDIFRNNRDNYVYFSEDVYYNGVELYDEKNRSKEKEIYKNISDKIAFNENIIKSNYLKGD